MADLTGDGVPDVVSGSYPGTIHLFAGDGKGGFAEGQILKGKDGKKLKAGKASAVAVADWDRDGDLDLLVGNIDGAVHQFANVGSREKPVFGTPERIEAGGEPVSVPNGDAGPSCCDWDGDGAVDLLVGAGDGSVRFYRNAATSGPSRLAAPVVLVPARGSGRKDTAAGDCADRAKVCAADWNGDGRLDLLLGDYKSSRGKEPVLDPEQKAERDRLQKEKRASDERFGLAYERVAAMARKDLGLKEGPLGDEDEDRLEERMRALREEDAQYKEAFEASAALSKKLRPLTPAWESHGRVWVFLRKPPAPAPLPETSADRR